MASQDQTILGIIESVSFPELGLVGVPAKIDTGAYSGALHCELIEEIVLPESGKKALKIVPLDAHYEPRVITKFATVYTTSSSGHRLRRYLIDTTVLIGQKEYPMRIGITQRPMMNMKVLIGRRFLRTNNMLVDVNLNAELDLDGGQKI